MKAIYTFLFVSIFICTSVDSQELAGELAPEGFLEKAHQERIYVHHNSAVVFPGEYFLYSVFNLNNTTGKLSSLSKVAYVELLGQKGNVVFRQKVNLKNGRGNADFFIPTAVPSGNYKLVAYTNWMRNVENNYFESDIVLINPYQSNQKELLEERTEFSSGSKTPGTVRAENSSQNGLLSIDLNKRSFSNREQVSISLNSLSLGALQGNYSLSVRKVETLPLTTIKTAVSAVSKVKNFETKNDQVLNLPELRGQLISGRIVAEGGNSSGNRIVALSVPSEEGLMNLAATNEEGQFFFNLEPDVRSKNAVLEVVGKGRNDFKIELDHNPAINAAKLNFSDYTLTPAMEDLILQRSIYNQIENAFFAVKPDTLVPAGKELLFPPSIVETYHLDDYTRFKSVPETFVEIIKSAWLRKDSAGELLFQVRGLMNYVDMGVLPLVMIDGLLVQDHNIAAAMDARRISTIKIVRDKIFLGPASFQGAVIFETVNSDFFEEHAAPSIKNIELFNPQVPKRYFHQVYTAETKDNRIPDFRYQLLWNPSLNLKEREERISFYTSDVNGDFEIVLEGFTADGKPVSLREQFRVE